MPVIAAVKDSNVLIDVEVEQLVRGKRPGAIIGVIREYRDCENSRYTDKCFSDEKENISGGGLVF